MKKEYLNTILGATCYLATIPAVAFGIVGLAESTQAAGLYKVAGIALGVSELVMAMLL